MSNYYDERDWDFSFCATQMRETGKMQFRFRDDEGNEIKVDRLAGNPYADGDLEATLGQKGHMKVRGDLLVEERDGQVVAFVDAIEEKDTEPYEVSETLDWQHVRVCANLGVNPGEENKERWRLHDERRPMTDPDSWRWVKSLRGKMNLNWFDKGSHVFHEGKVEVDTNGVGHFISE